jgi:hypothetical protein
LNATATFILGWGPHKVVITVPEASITGSEALFVAGRLRELANIVESKVLAREPSAVALACLCPRCMSRRLTEGRAN